MGADWMHQGGSCWGLSFSHRGTEAGAGALSKAGQQLRSQLGLLLSTCGVPVWPVFPHSLLGVSEERGREPNGLV